MKTVDIDLASVKIQGSNVGSDRNISTNHVVADSKDPTISEFKVEENENETEIDLQSKFREF